MTDPTIAAGWYPDPERADGLRYWDGAAWTEHRAPRPAGAAPPPPGRIVTHDQSTAVTALVVSILGFLLCQVLAPVGMVMGRNEVRRIDAGDGDPSARGMAQAGYVIGLVGTILLVVVVVGLLLFLLLAIGMGDPA